jgi:hypothetical protein
MLSLKGLKLASKFESGLNQIQILCVFLSGHKKRRAALSWRRLTEARPFS